MTIEKQAQAPTLDPTIHAVAKPAMRAVAWAMTAAGAVALALAGARTVVRGD